MRRRQRHEEPANHEGWAIPYGDLVTLLLAFFVVMYAISSVNEGKYRVVSESLNSAFRGAPAAPTVIQLGGGQVAGDSLPVPGQAVAAEVPALEQVTRQVEQAMGQLIMQGMVDVHRGEGFVEVAIRSDLLFASGSAQLESGAVPVIRLLGQTLGGFANDVRVEGHTDDVPISTAQFQSNWELSAARAANVVHLLTDSGVAPQRLSVQAFGKYRPVLPNSTPDGRAANRRVVLTVLGSEPGS